MSDVQITDVRAAHQFDQNALREYMTGHVAGFSGDLTFPKTPPVLSCMETTASAMCCCTRPGRTSSP